MPHTRFNHLESEVDFYPHPDYTMSMDREYWPGPNRGDGKKHKTLSKDAKALAKFGEQGSAGKTGTASKEPARKTEGKIGEQGSEGKTGTESKQPVKRAEGYWRRDGVWIPGC